VASLQAFQQAAKLRRARIEANPQPVPQPISEAPIPPRISEAPIPPRISEAPIPPRISEAPPVQSTVNQRQVMQQPVNQRNQAMQTQQTQAKKTPAMQSKSAWDHACRTWNERQKVSRDTAASRSLSHRCAVQLRTDVFFA